MMQWKAKNLEKAGDERKTKYLFEQASYNKSKMKVLDHWKIISIRTSRLCFTQHNKIAKDIWKKIGNPCTCARFSVLLMSNIIVGWSFPRQSKNGVVRK